MDFNDTNTRKNMVFFRENADVTIFTNAVWAPGVENGLDLHADFTMSRAIAKLEEWVPKSFKNEPGSPLNVVFVCLGMKPSDGPVGDHVIYTDPALPPSEVLERVYHCVKPVPEVEEA